MATQFTSNTLPGIYNDDFDENDNYHQILFNSGRALQARELTQLQTMLYRELGRFGKNIFKEGAVISSAPTSINPSFSYVKIASTNAGGAFEDIPVGSIFINPETGITAQVLKVVQADGANFTFDTLYIQYINLNSAEITADKTTFGDGETLYDENGLGYELITEVPNAAGEGTLFSVGEGDFFVLGRFVHVASQDILLSPYTKSVSKTIGFKVIQDVVTVNDTTSLYDNSGGIVNTTSPGADRYRISLQLTTQDAVTSDDTFVFLANVENSVITEVVDPNDSYNKINDLLALRTKEESGNYIVEPFFVNITEGNLDSNLELVVSRGTAYVNGYRVHNPSPIKLLVPKPSQTETIENDVIPVIYGNYFLSDSSRGLPNLDLSEVNLYSAFSAGGSTIGTARIRAVEEDGAKVRVYVFDVNMNADQNVRDIYSVGTGSTDRFDLVRETNGATLYQTIDNDLLFPTPTPRPESFSDVTITYQKYQTGTANGSGVLALTAATGETYVDASLWLAGTASSTFNGSLTVTGIGTGSATITGLTPSTAYEVLSYVQKSSTASTNLAKAKIPTTVTATLQRKIDSAGIYYNFDLPDVYQIDSVRKANSVGADLKSLVVFDNGQRDNYYADSRLILKGDSVGPLYVNYKYFARGGSGNYYDATSYSAIEYRDISDHVLKDGTTINLRNYLDFRSDIDSDGVVSNNHSLPRNGTNLTCDVNYYLPRADKLIATQEGDIVILMGQQAANPQFKPTPNNALELYKIVLNANTLNENDLQVTPIEHKRYTMADIAKLEAKLDQLSEYTTLSIRELDLKLSNALDSAGNVRIETGILVDDHKDQTHSETTNPDYSASLDPESNLIRPKLDEDNIRLIVDNALSSGIVKKGDNIYLSYDSAEWGSQLLASRVTNINPFGFVDNVGTLKLSPSSDEWKESFEEAQRAIGGSNRLDLVQAYLWNNWMWNWCGRSVEDVQLNYDNRYSGTSVGARDYLKQRENYYSSSSIIANSTSNGKFVYRVCPSDTIRSMVGNRVIDIALIPWIRSRKVYFHAKGLTPNTKFTPFFDGTDVSSWCREETTFVQWADRDSDNGNLYTSATYTAHPETTSDLISDENGEVIGSFFIPNIRPTYGVQTLNQGYSGVANAGLRFRAGVREFKLLDINRNDWAASGSKCFSYYTAVGAINNRVGAVLTTRPQTYTLPFGGFLNINIPSIYTTNELTTVLNTVSATDLGIIGPKLSGQYGTTAAPLSGAAVNLLDINSQMSKILSDYVGVNYNQSSTAEGTTLSPPQNPLAQTFYVDNQFGVVLTKIELFFAQKPTSTNYPVSIHIRPVENGKPSVVDIVPGSHIFVNPGDVTVMDQSATLSTIQQSGTNFVFDEPIYLQPWTQYAIVIASQSTEYLLYTAKTTERVFGSTTRTVTTQAAPGSLFLPSSGILWIETKDEDIMYRMVRANFSVGGGTLFLKNAPLPAKLLQNNSIRTTSGTKKLYFSHPCSGLEPGDPVIIADVTAVAGITAANINGSRTVDSADIHGFTITAGGASNATSTLVGGGDDILTTRNRVFNLVNPYIETIIPNFTSVDMSAKFTSGKTISGSTTRFVKDTQYSRVTPKMNAEFVEPKAIYQPGEETIELGGDASAYFKIDMKTSNNYVSPIVDLQRTSLILVQYCLDDPTISTTIYEVSETEAYGGTTGSKHIMTPVFLEQAAVGMQIFMLANLPNGSGVDFYYRTARADEDIKTISWAKQTPLNSVTNDNSMTFKDIEFLPGGRGGNLPAFQQAQFKVVMTGTGVSSPAIRDIRAKFMAV
jgi:hypothetical protein